MWRQSSEPARAETKCRLSFLPCPKLNPARPAPEFHAQAEGAPSARARLAECTDYYEPAPVPRHRRVITLSAPDRGIGARALFDWGRGYVNVIRRLLKAHYHRHCAF